VADTNVHLEYHRQFLCVLPLHLGPTNLFNNKHVDVQGIRKHSLRKQKKPEKRLLTAKTTHTHTQPTAPFWTSKSSLLSRCETNATQMAAAANTKKKKRQSRQSFPWNERWNRSPFGTRSRGMNGGMGPVLERGQAECRWNLPPFIPTYSSKPKITSLINFLQK